MSVKCAIIYRGMNSHVRLGGPRFPPVCAVDLMGPVVRLSFQGQP